MIRCFAVDTKICLNYSICYWTCPLNYDLTKPSRSAGGHVDNSQHGADNQIDLLLGNVVTESLSEAIRVIVLRPVVCLTLSAVCAMPCCEYVWVWEYRPCIFYVCSLLKSRVHDIVHHSFHSILNFECLFNTQVFYRIL